MKKYFVWAVLCMAMCVGVCSCDGDDETEKTTIENCLGGKVTVLDDDEKGKLLFYRNHLVVYIEDKNNVRDACGYMCGIGVGTWRDRGNALSSMFTASQNTYKSFKEMLPENLSVVEKGSNVLLMEDDSYKSHGLKVMGTFEDYTDNTEHDKALYGTWTNSPLYWNTETGFQTELHCSMTINKNGTMRMVVPELNTDFTTTYITKDGRVTFEKYDENGWDIEKTFIYVREGARLMMFSENRGKLYKEEEWKRKE